MSEQTAVPKSKEASPAAQQHLVAIVVNNQELMETMMVPGDSSQAVLVLMPGLNLVDLHVLQACMGSKGFEAKFKTLVPRQMAREAQLEHVGEPMLIRGRDVLSAAPLSKIPDEEAHALVKRIDTEDLVLRLLASEGRSEIRAALEARRIFVNTGKDEDREVG